MELLPHATARCGDYRHKIHTKLLAYYSRCLYLSVFAFSASLVPASAFGLRFRVNLRSDWLHAPVKRTRTRTAADGDRYDASLALNSDGTGHPLPVKEHCVATSECIRSIPGLKCYHDQSMCTDVVIGVVIGKTSAYCRPTAD